MTKPPALSREEMVDFLKAEFPQVFAQTNTLSIDSVTHGTAQITLKADERHLRPGGTISGPTMMMMADCCGYIAVLSIVGKVALAVTTNLNINFLRKPLPGHLVCKSEPLKIGKRLIVVECSLYSADDPAQKTIAHATLTFSVPPNS